MGITLADILRIKEERGYSVAKLSEYSGVPVGTLQKLLRGDSANPRKATLDALEKVLFGDEKLYPGKAYTYQMDSQPGMLNQPRIYGAERIYVEQGEYTLQDYYALPDDRRVELINGFFYDMAAPSTLHQHIAGMFYRRISDFIEENDGDCMSFISPIDVQLDRDVSTMVQPDVIIVCDPKKVKHFGIFGAPDFVLEVLSKSTKKRDITLKLTKYMEAGVREYWAIDTDRRILIVYLAEEDAVPHIYPFQGEAGVQIYGGRLRIDLEKLDRIMDQFGSLPGADGE